jgi:2-keto-4-pentenoate hydratase/2-oxohepta-3-ene-1,7-dioic acid hydratase in catechol pathway
VKLATFAIDDGPDRLGVVLSDDRVLDLSSESDEPALQSMLAFIDAGQSALALAGAAARRAADSGAPVHAVRDVALRAPIPRPRKNVFCVGLNYQSHVEQNAKALGITAEVGDVPLFFSKPVTAVIGTGQPIRHDSRLTSKLDYEIELTMVIGRGGSWISEETALDHVFGWTIGNDVSARDLQWRTSQFLYGKGQDSYCPIGPWIVTGDELPPLGEVQLELLVNGELRQAEAAGTMIFSPARVIAELSKGITLEPGDLITLGTPGGCGYQMVPPTFLQPGDTVECRATGIGSLINEVIAVG